MALDSQFHNLRDLSLDLQTILRSHFPQSAPIQVFCMQMRHKLLVMVQHSARVMPDEQAVEQVIQSVLEHNPPTSIHRWLMETDSPQMELFLRITGDNQVYASGIFDLHPDRRSLHWPPIPPLVPAPVAPEPFTHPDETLTEPAESVSDTAVPELDTSISTDPAAPLAAEPIDDAVLDAFNESEWSESDSEAIAAESPPLEETHENLDSFTDTAPTVRDLDLESSHDDFDETLAPTSDALTELDEPPVTDLDLADETVLDDVASMESVVSEDAPLPEAAAEDHETVQDHALSAETVVTTDDSSPEATVEENDVIPDDATPIEPSVSIDDASPETIAESGETIPDDATSMGAAANVDDSLSEAVSEEDLLLTPVLPLEELEESGLESLPLEELKESVPEPSTLELSEKSALEPSRSEKEESTTEPPPGGALVPTGDRSAAAPEGAIALSTEPDPELVAIPSGVKSTSLLSQLRRKRWLAAGIAGVVAIVGGAYALTRPCVLGDCENLVQAQQLDAQASDLIQSPQSAQDAVDAYDQWVDASYLLQQIPPWSPFYAQAQRLLQIYETRIGVLDNVVQAQRQAYAAAVKSQDPPHPIDVWREVRVLWQDAISLLSEVPVESSVYPLAQTKLEEYESNLQAIDRRIDTERSAQSKIQSAREAATVAEARQQIANSLQEWQQTHQTWQSSIALLKQVPPNTMSHAEARQLLEIYQLKLNAARDRLQQETIAQSAYQQALALADEAKRQEDVAQWSQAVVNWRDALNQAQQVPQNTTYYDQAQPLVETYTRSLSVAEEKLQRAVARQEAETQLANLCNTSQWCTFAALSDRLQVRVTQASLGQGSFPLPGTSQPIAEPFNDLLRSVADVGRQAQVKIDVFNVDGTLFGTYTPDVNGYVPPSNGSTPEPYRF